jgi:hypothetical protein
MNQLGDMGNKEKQITQQGWHTRRKKGRNEGEGRRRQSFMAMPPPYNICTITRPSMTKARCIHT